MTRSLDASGRTVDRPGGGMAIPLDVAGASPGDLVRFLPPSDRPIVDRLTAGPAGVIGATESRLRGIGTGGALQFGHSVVQVAGVVPDAAIGGHELLVSRSEAALLGVSTERYVLVQAGSGTGWRSLARAIRRLLPAGSPIRIRSPGQASFLREADSVLPPVLLKVVFGEFPASPQVAADGSLALDPAWVRSHIVSASVPILGMVACNRALIPPLRGALAELQARGLASLVNPNDYGGCFNARLIRGSRQDLSSHAWGAAIDLNVSRNPFGEVPHQDPRLVAIFERWGFAWGGRFLIPDGMHFQFQCFPRGIRGRSSLACSAPEPAGPPSPSPSRYTPADAPR
jgi:hypothetical protein